MKRSIKNLATAILFVGLISLLGGCDNFEKVKDIKAGDTLHYVYTGMTTYTFVVVKNDTLNKILKVKEQNIFNKNLWTEKYMYYGEVAENCTRWK